MNFGLKETNYRNVCRICLQTVENMDDFFTLWLLEESLAVDFLRRITDLKLVNSDTLPHRVCPTCRNNIYTAYNLVKSCINSDTTLRNEETRRMLRKIEAEALEEEVTDKNEDTSENQCNLSQINTINQYYDIGSEKDISDEDLVSNHKYKCELCSFSCNSNKSFLKHVPIHQQKPFKCKECCQSFAKEKNLNVHLHIHKKDSLKFSCQHCDKKFRYEYQLKRHEFKHMEEKPYPCQKCNKGCLTAESLRRHMKIHDENYVRSIHICDICKKIFPYPSYLIEHMKYHTGEKPHLCSICGKSFRQTGALHFHQRIHTGYKPFTCKICEEKFISRSVLKVHMRKHTNERPYVCDTCGTSFRQSQDLKRHRSIHVEDKLVLCTICGKRFTTTGQLTVHIRTHTGERPFACATCPRAFTTRSLLKKHERIHTGEKPYECNICGKAFNQSSTLKTHGNVHLKEGRFKRAKTKKVQLQGTEKDNLSERAVILIKDKEVNTEIEQRFVVNSVIEINAEGEHLQ